MNLEKDLNEALISNLRLKAKIMAIMLGSIFGVQIIFITTLYFNSDIFQKHIPLHIAFIGPVMILSACLVEIYAIRYFNSSQGLQRQISGRFTYVITFSEISFPSLLLIFAGLFIGGTGFVQPEFLLASPPGLIYFILIILSAFTLDRRLCIFAGAVAAVEYIAIAAYFIVHYNRSLLDLPNNIIKGVLMLVCGIVAGLVSKKIRDAVMVSLHSKNQLIHKLDALVDKKTEEINLQKEKLVEKNKEIMDSIHYAKRIQSALMPTEKFLDKLLRGKDRRMEQ
jgi:adenylate cyclase